MIHPGDWESRTRSPAILNAMRRLHRWHQQQVRCVLVARMLLRDPFYGEEKVALANATRNRCWRRMMVWDAQRRGIVDAEWHESWKLYQPSAYKNRDRCVRDVENSSWPLIWRVGDEWFGGGCGNAFNKQVDPDRAFRRYAELYEGQGGQP